MGKGMQADPAQPPARPAAAGQLPKQTVTASCHRPHPHLQQALKLSQAGVSSQPAAAAAAQAKIRCVTATAAGAGLRQDNYSHTHHAEGLQHLHGSKKGARGGEWGEQLTGHPYADAPQQSQAPSTSLRVCTQVAWLVPPHPPASMQGRPCLVGGVLGAGRRHGR